MDERFLREAIALAEQSIGEGGGPFGAVVVKDGVVVGRGSNRVTLHNDPTAHAEVMAIRDACRNLGDFSLQGCTLYVNCEPCPMCLSAAYWARLDAVCYAAEARDAAEVGFDDAFIYRELALQAQDRQLFTRQALREEALPVFAAWKALEGKIPY